MTTHTSGAADLPEALHRVIDDFERRERGIPQAHIAAALVTELRAALAAGQAPAQPDSTEGVVFRTLIKFLLCTDEALVFLRCWNEGNFDACRKEWPEAPSDLYPDTFLFQAAQQAPAGANLFDEQGFRDWVLRNLPDDTIIGNGAWWADHLTERAKRFMKAAPAAPSTPALWVSPEQLAGFVDRDLEPFGTYIPARKTSAGKFTMPLFAASPTIEGESK